MIVSLYSRKSSEEQLLSAFCKFQDVRALDTDEAICSSALVRSPEVVVDDDFFLILLLVSSPPVPSASCYFFPWDEASQ
jgi:hypothetical protein